MIDSWGSEAILDAFAPKNVKKIDFAAMEKKELQYERMRVAGGKLGSGTQ